MRFALVLAALALPGCLESPQVDVWLRQVTLQPPPLEVVDTPIAVILPEDADLAAAARADGADIHFVSAEGDRLPHEIEEYSGATGALVAWVRVPVVADGVTLELRYGGSEVDDAATVFSDYAGVWHLAEDPAKVPPQMKDSAPSGNSGTVIDDPPLVIRGAAGPALSFDRTGIVNIGDPTDGSLDFGTESFTYEAWVNVDQDTEIGIADRPWDKGGATMAQPGYAFALGVDNWGAKLNDGAVAATANLATVPIVGRWVHIVAVVDRGAGQLHTYVDGQSSDDSDLGPLSDLSVDRQAAIGGAQGRLNDFLGGVDEVRVRPGVLAADLIAVQHANLRAPEDFLSVGPQEPVP